MSSATLRKVPTKTTGATPVVKKKPSAAARPTSPSATLDAVEPMELEAPGAPTKKRKPESPAEPSRSPSEAGEGIHELSGLSEPEPSGNGAPKAPTKGGSVNEANQAMKDAILGRYKSRRKVSTAILKTGGSALPTITALGVVTSCRPVRVNGKEPGQKVDKIECGTIEVLKIKTNNAMDAIEAGIDGCQWLLPTLQPKGAAARDASDDSPDGDSGGKAKEKQPAPPRHLKFSDPSHKMAWVGGSLRRLSFYTQKPGNPNEQKEGIELIVPGMIVEVTGIVAGWGDDGKTLWVNAKDVTPKLDGIVPGKHDAAIMTALGRPEMMAAAAFRLSMCARGFFGYTSADKPACEEQAAVFRNKWLAARDGTVGACEAKAMFIRDVHGAEGEQLAGVLDHHVKRLKGDEPADLAFGKPFFTPMLPVSADRPAWTAPIVIKGLTPEWPRHEMLWALTSGPGPSRDLLPHTFCCAEPVDTALQGCVLNVTLRLTFIGNKAKAVEALEAGIDPVLDTGDYASLGVKLNMRDLPLKTGTRVLAKAEAFCPDLARFGTWWAIAGVTPREYSDTSVAAVFPSAYGFDMVASLESMTVPVTEEWFKKNLLNEDEQSFEYDEDVTTVNIKGPDKQTDLKMDPKDQPTIKRDYYQMCLEKNWRFKSALMPADAPVREYRVWYQGVCDELEESPELARVDPAGRSMTLIEEVAKDMDDCKSTARPVQTFLKRYCLVYCIARPMDR